MYACMPASASSIACKRSVGLCMSQRGGNRQWAQGGSSNRGSLSSDLPTEKAALLHPAAQLLHYHFISALVQQSYPQRQLQRQLQSCWPAAAAQSEEELIKRRLRGAHPAAAESIVAKTAAEPCAAHSVEESISIRRRL